MIVRAEIKAAREAEIDAPLLTPHGAFDHDEKSRAVIAAKAQVCMATGAGMGFTLADNSHVEFTAEQMSEVWAASHRREQSARANAAKLRAAVDAAGKPADISSIEWAISPPT